MFDTIDHKTGKNYIFSGPGLYAINRDATGFRKLISHSWDGMGNEMYRGVQLPPYTATLLPDMGRQDTDFVYILTPGGGGSYVELQRLNTTNGQVHSVRSPEGASNWMLYQNGEPRIAMAMRAQYADHLLS